MQIHTALGLVPRARENPDGSEKVAEAFAFVMSASSSQRREARGAARHSTAGPAYRGCAPAFTTVATCFDFVHGALFPATGSCWRSALWNCVSASSVAIAIAKTT